ncbi:MAG: hypothetical protein AAF429_04475 [Pseudomonadota bacterium]
MAEADTEFNGKIYLKIFGYFYVLTMLLQLSQGVISQIFVSRFSLSGIFNNVGQMFINSIFFAGVLFIAWLVVVKLLQLFKLQHHRYFFAFVIAATLPVILLFKFAARDSSIPITANYRGCYIKIDGILTECGLASLYYDLVANLICIFCVALILFLNLRKLG